MSTDQNARRSCPAGDAYIRGGQVVISSHHVRQVSMDGRWVDEAGLGASCPASSHLVTQTFVNHVNKKYTESLEHPNTQYV